MNWRIKAIVQKVLSLSIIGDKINHLNAKLKRNYHKNVCIYQFYECLRKWNLVSEDISNKTYALEIGTGYSLISSIVMSFLGFKNIITVDITNDINFKTVKKQAAYLLTPDLFEKLVKNSEYTKEEVLFKINFILKSDSLEQILNFFNIIYIPKYNFSDIEEYGSDFDYIYSQVVLEHIRPTVLKELFENIKIWLNKNGRSVHTINFIDHFTNPGFFEDKSISLFNFLKYSDKTWKFWAGNSISYTNRLCYKYYIELCDTNELELISFYGENYREFRLREKVFIHSDVRRKYIRNYDDAEFIKYQRGTIVIKNK